MLPFVDPRSNPEPPARVSREPAAHGEELLSDGPGLGDVETITRLRGS